MWVFLFADKAPPISAITMVLNTHGVKDGRRQVRTDRGGLVKSTAFRQYIMDAGYTLE